MSNVKEELATYFQSVERRLRCSKKRRNERMERIFRAAEEFVTERPNATKEEILAYLGDPDEVAQDLMSTLAPEEIAHYKKRKKMIIQILIGILAAALVAVSIGVICLLKVSESLEVVETLIVYE